MLSSVQANQWKNSQEVIEWFKNIQNKKNALSIVFDIKSFLAINTTRVLQ